MGRPSLWKKVEALTWTEPGQPSEKELSRGLPGGGGFLVSLRKEQEGQAWTRYRVPSRDWGGREGLTALWSWGGWDHRTLVHILEVHGVGGGDRLVSAQLLLSGTKFKPGETHSLWRVSPAYSLLP